MRRKWGPTILEKAQRDSTISGSTIKLMSKAIEEYNDFQITFEKPIFTITAWLSSKKTSHNKSLK